MKGVGRQVVDRVVAEGGMGGVGEHPELGWPRYRRRVRTLDDAMGRRGDHRYSRCSHAADIDRDLVLCSGGRVVGVLQGDADRVLAR